MRIGCIFVAYNAADYLQRSLDPWIKARETDLDGHEFVICAVSVPFEGFEHAGELDNTRSILGAAAHSDEIDHVIVGDRPMKEIEARGAALNWLKDKGVELIIQIDADEIWEIDQIEKALGFVVSRPLSVWFRACYKNLIFDDKTYLIEPFAPPRIHRIRHGCYEACGFWDDNNVQYRGTITRDIRRDDSFANLTVPKAQVWVRHMTWLSDARSRLKLEYQRRRWGASSFRWDEKTGLQFDETYYRSRGLSIPETATES